GAARATGAPVALVCTSGTAAAHYLPAIIEASMAGVPLVAITADRPPELKDCGASQTIDQIKMYGGFVRSAFDLGAPTDGELALAARAGYPILPEAGSQLRFGPRADGVLLVDHFDLIPAAALPVPRLVIQLGAEPVAAAWPAWAARVAAAGSARWVLAGPRWHDADSSARSVILGDPAAAIDALGDALDTLGARGPGGSASD